MATIHIFKLLTKKQKHAVYSIITGFLLLFLANLVFNQPSRRFNIGKVEQFQSLLSSLESEANSGIQRFLNDDVNWFKQDSVNDLETSSIDYFVEKNNQLIYWTDNKVNPIRIGESGFYKFSNGWYELIVKKSQSITVYAIIPLKRVYNYENKYLRNHFIEPFSLSESWDIKHDSTANSKKVVSLDGAEIFLKNSERALKIPGFIILFEWIGLFAMIIGLFYFFIGVKNKLTGSVVMTISMITGFILLSSFQFPKFIYQLEIFQTNYSTSSSHTSSLGEILLAGLFFIVFILFIYKNFKRTRWSKSSSNRVVIYLISGIMIATVYSGVFYFVDSLAAHSTVTLDFTNILDFNFYSFITYFIVACLFVSAHLLGDILLSKLTWENRNLTMVLWLGVVLTMMLIFLVIGDFAMMGVIIVLLIQFWHQFKSQSYSFGSAVLLIMGYSFISALIIHTEVNKKELSWRMNHSEIHANERDQIAENLYLELKESLESDVIIQELVSDTWERREGLNHYLNKYYFSTYWEKFQVQATPTIPTDSMYLQGEQITVHCDTYFNNTIRDWGVRISDDFYFMKNPLGSSAYIARLFPIDGVTIYLEFDSKLKDDGLGFPELLLDEKLLTKKFDPKYSYAKYTDGELVQSSGNFSYPLWITKDYQILNDFENKIQGDMNHLIHNYGEDKVLVVSKKSNGLVAWITSFSYQFCFFSLFALVFFGLWTFISKQGKFESDFKRRLQFSMLSILLISLVLVGAGSIYYLVNQNHEKNQLSIKEKIKSVQIEVEHKLSNEGSLEIEMQDYLQSLMIKFSKVFFTDISLYDIQGRLLASSQPRVFSEGLTSPMMNPDAFEATKYDQKSLYIHEEEVGDLKYLSAYVPFTNDNNELMAYLNLPYFAKQGELQSQINQFLVAIINIYVLLIVLAILTTVIIYQRLTRPLRLIQEKFKKISLQESNELIEWQGQDELGDLVQAYNKLVIELGDSANKLAQSEREGAWKEMARQVAHEIKNPLTPMKLSIQHLQRVADPSDPGFTDHLNRVTKNLIEQIDALSNIASEFSSFAKMPDPVFDDVDLAQVLRSTSDLYMREPNVRLKWNPKVKKAMIRADKDQMLRVFNNLIKNAIQATENRSGQIDITLEEKDSAYLVSIKDNGIGISEEIKSRIFVPNFTTKTSGSGLGLAMVKNIIETTKGTIWFESKEQEGSIFYVKLPFSE